LNRRDRKKKNSSIKYNIFKLIGNVTSDVPSIESCVFYEPFDNYEYVRCATYESNCDVYYDAKTGVPFYRIQGSELTARTRFTNCFLRALSFLSINIEFFLDDDVSDDNLFDIEEDVTINNKSSRVCRLILEKKIHWRTIWFVIKTIVVFVIYNFVFLRTFFNNDKAYLDFVRLNLLKTGIEPNPGPEFVDIYGFELSCFCASMLIIDELMNRGYIDNDYYSYKYMFCILFVVMCLSLILNILEIGGVESNPGPHSYIIGYDFKPTINEAEFHFKTTHKHVMMAGFCYERSLFECPVFFNDTQQEFDVFAANYKYYRVMDCEVIVTVNGRLIDAVVLLESSNNRVSTREYWDNLLKNREKNKNYKKFKVMTSDPVSRVFNCVNSSFFFSCEMYL
jgi:hypothetical protein